jgi:hypothetical protein
MLAIISRAACALGLPSPATSAILSSVSVSATPAVQIPQTRTPCGPTSAAR